MSDTPLGFAIFPFYYTMLTLIALSGFNMASVLKFDISYNSYIMILSVFLLIGLGIYEFKMLKKTIKTKSFIEFRKKAKMQSLFDLYNIICECDLMQFLYSNDT